MVLLIFKIVFLYLSLLSINTIVLAEIDGNVIDREFVKVVLKMAGLISFFLTGFITLQWLI
jgi:hypothetical protein